MLMYKGFPRNWDLCSEIPILGYGNRHMSECLRSQVLDLGFRAQGLGCVGVRYL